MRVFYGWWIVIACMLCALVGNALGLFGAGVYLHEVVTANGWATGLVSGAVTLLYVVSALLLIPVGIGIRRYGPRPIIALGGIALAAGVIEIGRASTPWQAYLAFLFMGIGWAGLSTTAVATTLAPWFDKHQGRAVSIASLGASVGGIIGAPALLFGIARVGFASTTIAAGIVWCCRSPRWCCAIGRRTSGLFPTACHRRTSPARPVHRTGRCQRLCAHRRFAASWQRSALA
jgi:MFS family permease